MRNPRRWRTIALCALLLGVALLVAAFKLPQAWAGDGARAALFFMALFGVLYGPFGAWSAHRAARAQASLQRGDDVLARWRVDAPTWRAFLDMETGLAGKPGVLPNELPTDEQAPAEGLEIVVGQEAIAIGNSVHVLPRHGAPEIIDVEMIAGQGTPDLFQLQLRHPPAPRSGGGMGPPLYTRLAFPIAATAWRDARKAEDFYAKGRPGKASFFHGKGDGSDAEDLSSCPHCGFQTHEFRATCQRCGRDGMLTRRWARRFGGVLLVLGAGLAIGMAFLLYIMTPMLADPGVQHGSSRFNGTPRQALAIWTILGGVLVFGLVAAIGGGWCMATGRRDKRVAYVLLGLVGLIVLSAFLLAR